MTPPLDIETLLARIADLERSLEEASRGIECLADIDDAWNAIGTRANRGYLSLAEQVGALLREDEARIAELERERDEARRERGDISGTLYDRLLKAISDEIRVTYPDATPAEIAYAAKHGTMRVVTLALDIERNLRLRPRKSRT